MGDITGRAVADALATVLADVGPLVALIGPIAVRQVLPSAAEPDAAWLAGLPGGSSRWILQAGGSTTALDELSMAQLRVTIAAYLQNRVIDETGGPWPEIVPLGVADARIVECAAWWCIGAVPIAAVGNLRGATIA